MIQRKLFPILLNKDINYVIFSLNVMVKVTIEALAECIYNDRFKWDDLNQIMVKHKHGDLVLARYLRGSLFTTFPTYKELSPIWLKTARENVLKIWEHMYTAGDQRDKLLHDVMFNQSTLFGFHFTFHKTNTDVVNNYIRVYPTAELPDKLTRDNHMVVDVDDSFSFDPITLHDTGMVRGELNFAQPVGELLKLTGLTVTYQQVNLDTIFSNAKSTHMPDST